ncbi:CidA/LrgA family protein [Limnobacter sp. MED105]|jgi:holin-like protein|uniref:CidA/LrgA family protein n=1 Tax=Limnobacter sp. MED105 TaxID=391597 RepID=UPI000156CC4C|nr:CidA/LrgA family protein [Limnobacter sp. MED105]EDM85171.1 LrgA family protein [Limnobacter sp. MED105]|eukprot:gene12089-11879_t
MLKSLTILLAFQALGELLSFSLFPSIPGPVLGLIALLAFFFIRGGVPADIQSTANVFTANLGLLFVPAAVGVVVFWPVLAEFGVVILITLLVSVVVTLVGTAWVLDKLATRFMPGEVSEGSKHE